MLYVCKLYPNKTAGYGPISINGVKELSDEGLSLDVYFSNIFHGKKRKYNDSETVADFP